MIPRPFQTPKEEGGVHGGNSTLRALPLVSDDANTVTTFQMPLTDRIFQGLDARNELPNILKDLDASRVLLITGRSLGRTDALAELLQSLDNEGVEVVTYVGVVAHNPVDGVLDIVRKAQQINPHVIISLGGGTPIDAGKLTALALAAGTSVRSEFLEYAVRFRYPNSEIVREVPEAPVPVVAIPTTLSAAEWDGYASCVDTVEQKKLVFRDRRITPRVVILDPRLAGLTPEELWVTSGVRAIDHAVETICSTKSHPYATSLALGALELLTANLDASRKSPRNPDTLLACQIAAGMSIAGIHTVSLGLSHALGHQLGAFGVPHGVTSCLTLPHVMRFLEPVTKRAQERIALSLRPNSTGNQSAADLMEELFTELEVPRRIRDFGIRQDDLEAIAERALTDVVIRECPIELSLESLCKLLERAW